MIVEKEIYGLRLLQRVVIESKLRNLAKLVVPVAVVEGLDTTTRERSEALIRACIDLGAVDVVTAPIDKRCLMSLELHAYRAHQEATKDKQALPPQSSASVHLLQASK